MKTTLLDTMILTEIVLSRQIRKIGEIGQLKDELLKRKLKKRAYSTILIALKFYSKGLEEADENAIISSRRYRKMSMNIGHWLYTILEQIDMDGVKLDHNDYMSIFNISYEDWNKSEKDTSVLDTVFLLMPKGEGLLMGRLADYFFI